MSDTIKRVAVYARVSTADKEQNPDNQLMLLRDQAEKQGWAVVGEYIDYASAKDMRGRTRWRELMHLVRSGGVDIVAVTRLDRGFRSVKDTYDGVAFLQRNRVDFIAVTQPLDTTSSVGKLALGILACFAEFERDLLIERTHEGLARARAEGKHLGRPKGAKDTKPRKRLGYLLRYADWKLREKYQPSDSYPYF